MTIEWTLKMQVAIEAQKCAKNTRRPVTDRIPGKKYPNWSLGNTVAGCWNVGKKLKRK